jgi:hypothetical protein
MVEMGNYGIYLHCDADEGEDYLCDSVRGGIGESGELMHTKA